MHFFEYFKSILLFFKFFFIVSSFAYFYRYFVDFTITNFEWMAKNNCVFCFRFRHALMTWGEKFSAKEVDDAFDAMDIDDNNRIDTGALITLLTAAQEEEGEAA